MLKEKKVVTCFLESDGKILLLRRSGQVSTYQGKWAGVSGYIDNSPDEQAVTEIAEETSLSKEDVSLLKKGEPLTATDTSLGVKWVIHPYLFHVKEPDKIKIDWEHKEAKWINPEALGDYDTVPKLKDALARVYSP